MTELEQRVAALEARLGGAEDRLEIFHLLAHYPLAMDSFREDALSEMFTQDAVLDQGAAGDAPATCTVDMETLRSLVHSREQQVHTAAGCAHVLHMPHIDIAGDTAVATGLIQLFVRDGDHWRSVSTSANRWELLRTTRGWKVAHWLGRPLDGTPEHRDILGRPFAATAARSPRTA